MNQNKELLIRKNKKSWLKLFCFVLLIPVLYSIFVVLFFFILPKFDSNTTNTSSHFGSNNSTHYGYNYPLNVIDMDDDEEYILCYYTSTIIGPRYWTVIDDQEALRKNKDKFIVYLHSSAREIDTSRLFHIYNNEGKEVFVADYSYFPHCLIFDDYFAPYKKILTKNEMKIYATEHNFEYFFAG